MESIPAARQTRGITCSVGCYSSVNWQPDPSGALTERDRLPSTN
ncbi:MULTISPECIES: hypothetical protein [Cyanophyceae]|nr:MULTISPECIES: hypothetical protein [unclassified Trichocoleus]